MSDVTVYEGSNEWSAVYVDGALVRVGDHYLADEWIREHFQVKTVQSNDFMMGGEGRDDVAKTLKELEGFANDRLHRELKAAELRARAAALEDEARELLT